MGFLPPRVSVLVLFATFATLNTQNGLKLPGIYNDNISSVHSCWHGKGSVVLQKGKGVCVVPLASFPTKSSNRQRMSPDQKNIKTLLLQEPPPLVHQSDVVAPWTKSGGKRKGKQGFHSLRCCFSIVRG